jgi:hypothetical protein
MHASQMLLTLEPPVSICNRDCDGMSIAAELRKLKVCLRASVCLCLCVFVCVCARACASACARAPGIGGMFDCNFNAVPGQKLRQGQHPTDHASIAPEHAGKRMRAHTLSLIRHVPLTPPSPAHPPSAVHVQPSALERGRSSRLALMILVMIFALEKRSFNCMMNRKCARSWS